MAKVVQVALTTSGATANIIPGATADLNRDGTQIDDTIFGQIFSSVQPGLINWGVTANAFYKGFAGYVATIKKGGTPTAFTDEAMDGVGLPANTFKITDATKNLWDRTATFTFNDTGLSGSPPIAAGAIVSINHLQGQVTLDGSETGPIEVTGTYLPLAAFGKANTFNLTSTAEVIDTTAFEDAQGNSGFNVFSQTLLSASLELSGFYDLANDFFTDLKNRVEVVIEINPDGSDLSVARGLFKMATDSQTGDVAGAETETVNFFLSVPEGLGAAPFQWTHDSTTTLSQAIIDLLTVWAAQDEIIVDYLPDGVTGFQGNAVVTDISLAGGVDVMNEFTVALQGTGTLVAI